MDGIKKNEVQIVKHDPEWATLAIQLRQDILAVCGEHVCDIQHVGSTAVPGLDAKPIIDLAIGVKALDVIPVFVSKLKGLGYSYQGTLSEILGTSTEASEGDHYFTKETSSGGCFVHLHAVQYEGKEWRDYIQFRDALTKDPHIRDTYSQLKQDLSRRFPNDRKSYTYSKHDFIQQILKGNGPTKP